LEKAAKTTYKSERKNKGKGIEIRTQLENNMHLVEVKKNRGPKRKRNPRWGKSNSPRVIKKNKRT